MYARANHTVFVDGPFAYCCSEAKKRKRVPSDEDEAKKTKLDVAQEAVDEVQKINNDSQRNEGNSDEIATPLTAAAPGISPQVIAALVRVEQGYPLTAPDILVIIQAGVAGLLPQSAVPPMKPRGNTAYLFDRRVTRIKQDGHEWSKESHTTLLVEGQPRVKIYYGYGMNEAGTLKASFASCF